MVQFSSEWIYVTDNLDDAQSVVSIPVSDDEQDSEPSMRTMPSFELVRPCIVNERASETGLNLVSALGKFDSTGSSTASLTILCVDSYVRSLSFVLECMCDSEHVARAIKQRPWTCGDLCKKYLISPELEKVASVNLRAGKVVGSLFKPDLSAVSLTERLGLA
jgi:hypothetical protein